MAESVFVIAIACLTKGRESGARSAVDDVYAATEVEAHVP
jgi:hypothetical protein